MKITPVTEMMPVTKTVTVVEEQTTGITITLSLEEAAALRPIIGSALRDKIYESAAKHYRQSYPKFLALSEPQQVLSNLISDLYAKLRPYSE